MLMIPCYIFLLWPNVRRSSRCPNSESRDVQDWIRRNAWIESEHDGVGINLEVFYFKIQTTSSLVGLRKHIHVINK